MHTKDPARQLHTPQMRLLTPERRASLPPITRPAALGLLLTVSTQTRSTPMPTKDPARQLRSLRNCHMPAERAALRPVRRSGLYTPELAETVERDPNLCDGARRCARLITGYVYRRDRQTRQSEITVTYLAKALARSRRTVQRYLRQLERSGYIRTEVVASQRSRLCIGLAITVCSRLLPTHHAKKWPDRLNRAGVTLVSQNHRYRFRKTAIPVELWSFRCMDGVFRALLRTLKPLPPFPSAIEPHPAP